MSQPFFVSGSCLLHHLHTPARHTEKQAASFPANRWQTTGPARGTVPDARAAARPLRSIPGQKHPALQHRALQHRADARKLRSSSVFRTVLQKDRKLHLPPRTDNNAPQGGALAGTITAPRYTS